MDLDLELSRMMETSVKELSVPVAVIVAESNRRGRRRRLARRLRIAGAALTVVVLAAVGANAGLNTMAAKAPATNTGPAGAVLASPTTSPSPFGSVAPSPDPDHTPMLNLSPAPVLGRPSSNDTPGPDGMAAFTPTQVQKVITALLPAEVGSFKDAGAFLGTLPVGTAGVTLQYVDGDGVVSSLEVMMRHSVAAFPKDRRAPDPSDQPFHCAETVLGTGERSTQGCEYGFLPDGTWEMVEANDAIVPGLYNYRVRLWRIDGTVLEFTEFNGPRDYVLSAPRKTRTTPPIPLDTWRGVAESQEWRWLSRPTD
ncbi:hypothetical protein [Kitasatospora sp. CB01950]|uniref:hypothetical protein n=1 Tax=Kitasatospora sp. CB01950 TaxID=1703930 RepID=UPI0009388D2D|nr:hypothetical protein [Kitasatospora sp. CB01950]OKJ15773.1 hypothetical protein AMK19_05810 [Kitasatospora sp. CB01950]